MKLKSWLLAVAVLVSGLAWSGCKVTSSVFVRPSCRLRSMYVGNGPHGRQAHLRVELENANPIALDLVAVGFRLELEGRPLADSVSPTTLSVPANRSGLIVLSFAVPPETPQDGVFDLTLRLDFGTTAGVVSVPFHALRVRLVTRQVAEQPEPAPPPPPPPPKEPEQPTRVPGPP